MELEVAFKGFNKSRHDVACVEIGGEHTCNALEDADLELTATQIIKTGFVHSVRITKLVLPAYGIHVSIRK